MLVVRVEPNPAHRAIAKMAELIPQFMLITQNVDDLHERAGSPEVIHLHGRLHEPFCERCLSLHELLGAIPDLPAGGVRIDPPRCTACGARIRPGVVWFGEELPQEAWQAATLAVSRADVMLTIGLFDRYRDCLRARKQAILPPPNVTVGRRPGDATLSYYRNLRQSLALVHQNEPPMETKTCTACKKTLPLGEFHRFGKSNERIGNWCEPCFVTRKAKSAAQRRAKSKHPQ